MKNLTLLQFLFSTLIVVSCSPWLSIAQEERTLSRVPSQSGQIPKPEFDEADLFWRSRSKYYLVVAATQTGGRENDLPFTKTDGRLVSNTLARFGYGKLEILNDRRATRDNFVRQLQRIRSLPENAVVVVYYSGHAIKDPQEKDLWLQLYGQADFGDHYGLSLSDLIGAARGKTYKGDLVVILDTCYSGLGTLSAQLSLRDTERTVIFASSTTYQQSYSVTIAGSEISAFTHFLLQGLGSDWVKVDGDSDGIILYSDLQIYIENKLLELLSNRAILGTMQPQIVGQSPRIWAAYNNEYARNLNTQTRQTLRLQRLFRVQNPEKLIDLLSDTRVTFSDPYIKALQAIKTSRYGDAWDFLEVAEREKTISLPEIYWARAYMKDQQGDIASARGWYEKALASSADRNPDLLFATALSNFVLGNWFRSKSLLKEAFPLTTNAIKDTEMIVPGWFLVVFVSIFQGDKKEAELYLTRLSGLNVENSDEFRSLSPFLGVLSDFLQNKRESAKRKIEMVRESIGSSKQNLQRTARSFVQMMDALFKLSDPTLEAAIAADPIREWAESLQKEDINRLVLLFSQFQRGFETTMVGDLRSSEVGDLLRTTVALARKHKNKKQSLTLETANGKSEIQVPNSEAQSELESSTLLVGAALIYAARGEVAQAENLLKEVILLAEESKEQEGPMVKFNAVFALASLYEAEGRVTDAEDLYSDYILKLPPQGEQGIFAYSALMKLGDLYDNTGRWTKAEDSYRRLMEITQAESGSIFDIGSREAFAKFLYRRGRYSEAAQLLEQVIEVLEKRQGNRLFDDSLGDNWFRLAQSYYYLRKYDLAEKSFQRTREIFWSREKHGPTDDLSCLVWQWFTADALNKTNETSRIFSEIVRLVENEAAKPRAEESFGVDLQDFAGWFRDSDGHSQADQLLRSALNIQQRNFGAQSGEVADVYDSFAYLRRKQGRYADSIVFLRQAESIYKQSPQDVVELADVLYWIGVALYKRQEFEKARLELRRSIDIMASAPEPVRQQNGGVKYLLGTVNRLLGHYAEAKQILSSTLDSIERDPKNNSAQFSSFLVWTLLEVAAVNRLEGDSGSASAHLRQVQSELKKKGATECGYCFARLTYENGMLAFATGRIKQAEQLLRESINKGTKAGTDEVLLTEFMRNYAIILRRKGKDKEADQLRQRSEEILQKLRIE